jgi:ankyrin repeat protein
MNRAIQKNAVPDFGLHADQLKRDNEGNTELMWITANAPVGWMSQYVQLKGNQAGINAQNWKGQTALYSAASLKAKDKVEFLLRSGAADYPTVEGVTALHVAAAMDDCDIAKLLVQHGSFINAQDDEDDTPLHWAVREGKVDMVRLLVKLGADYNCPNADGEDPLQLAACINDEELDDALAEAVEEAEEEHDAMFEDVTAVDVLAAGSPMQLDGQDLLGAQFANLLRDGKECDAEIPRSFPAVAPLNHHHHRHHGAGVFGVFGAGVC